MSSLAHGARITIVIRALFVCQAYAVCWRCKSSAGRDGRNRFDGLGGLLPAHVLPHASSAAGRLASSEAALRAAETAETCPIDRRLPATPGCPEESFEESFVNHGGVRKGLVAQGREPCGSPGHDAGPVQASEAGMPDRQVCRVTTLKETAGYDEYPGAPGVVWEDGPARRPATRFGFFFRSAD